MSGFLTRPPLSGLAASFNGSKMIKGESDDPPPQRPALPANRAGLRVPMAQTRDWGLGSRTIAALVKAGLPAMQFGKLKFFRGSATHCGASRRSGKAAPMTTTAQGSAIKPIEFRRISCKELDTTAYNLEYLIDGALVAGQPCMLAGGKKTLKTTLLIDLGIKLAMGGSFLGRLKVKRACTGGHYVRGIRACDDPRNSPAHSSGIRTSAGRYWRSCVL